MNEVHKCYRDRLKYNCFVKIFLLKFNAVQLLHTHVYVYRMQSYATDVYMVMFIMITLIFGLHLVYLL